MNTAERHAIFAEVDELDDEIKKFESRLVRPCRCEENDCDDCSNRRYAEERLDELKGRRSYRLHELPEMRDRKIAWLGEQ